MPTAAQVREYREAQHALVTLARNDLQDFWAALPAGTDPARVRAALERFFPDLVTAYGTTAAVLGADWYEAMRNAPPSAASFAAALAAPAATAQAQATARWAIGPLFQAEPDPVAALARLMGSTQRLVLQPARETIIGAAVRDPVRHAVARVPAGATTCQWCVMLASRGFVYQSRESAGEWAKFHDNCDCAIVTGQNLDDLPEDYDLDYYVELYTSGRGIDAAA